MIPSLLQVQPPIQLVALSLEYRLKIDNLHYMLGETRRISNHL